VHHVPAAKLRGADRSSPAADAAERPFFDPWHGRNPVLTYELTSVRRAIRASQRGCVRTALRCATIVFLIALTAAGAGLALHTLALAPDPIQMLRDMVTIGFGILLLAHLMHLFFFAVTTPLLHAAQSVSRERERGSWDLLRATPLEMRHIVLGKWLAVIESHQVMCAVFFSLGLLLCILYVPLVALQAGALPVNAWIALALGTVLATLVPFIGLGAGAATGLAVSTMARSSAVNAGIAQAVAGTLCFVGLPVIWGIASLVWLYGIVHLPTGSYRSAGSEWMLVGLVPFGVLAQIGWYSALALAALAFSAWRGEQLEN
jgi:hypothetical protein